MPIYEYVCQSCQHQFEVKQKFSDDPISSCVRCGKAVTKIISAPAIMFKGSGWYVTEYSDKLKAPGQSDSDSAQSGKSNNGKSDQTAPANSETAAPASTTSAASSSSADAGNSKPSSTPVTPTAATTPSS